MFAQIKFIAILFITTVLFFFFITLSAQENPFMKMANMKYAEYARDFSLAYYKFLEPDTIESQKILRQIEEVARQTGSPEWKLYAEYFNWLLRKTKSNSQVCSEEALQQLFDILKKAQKTKVLQIELRCRNDIYLHYFHSDKHELYLEQCDILAEQLQTVLSDDIPEKAFYYLQIGNRYYDFKDYPNSIFYFEKALNEKETIFNQGYRMGALNGMGLSYRYGLNDYERSDSYFRAILQAKYFCPEHELQRDKWDGVAEGNIGRNMMLRGEYDKAIPLFKSSMVKMLQFNDYGYTSGTAVNLAEIYLKKGNISEAKRYINLAREYYSIMPRKSNLPRIYEVMSKYYAITGNAKLSVAYLVFLRKAYNILFSNT